MNYTQHQVPSRILSNERDVFVHIPDSGRLGALLVFLDAELYRGRVEAPLVLEGLVKANIIESPAVVFVSYCTPEARWTECECHSPFTGFIVDELMPWLLANFPLLKDAASRVLVGLSYTGLAASWVALERPEAFHSIVSQSGSYWWNDSWICRQCARKGRAPLPSFYLNVGTKETDENVTHKEGVVQKVSQIEGVRDFRDALRGAGAKVRYEEFNGGHDSTCWRDALPLALEWATRNPSKEPAN